jgi:hypothetical protein
MSLWQTTKIYARTWQGNQYQKKWQCRIAINFSPTWFSIKIIRHRIFRSQLRKTFSTCCLQTVEVRISVDFIFRIGGVDLFKLKNVGHSLSLNEINTNRHIPVQRTHLLHTYSVHSLMTFHAQNPVLILTYNQAHSAEVHSVWLFCCQKN